MIPLLAGFVACSAAPEPELATSGTTETEAQKVVPAPPPEAEATPPEAEPDAEPEGDGAEKPASRKLSNTLRWSTASEVDNFGFDVYRSLSEEGPFERITDSPIPGAGTVDEPSKYIFEDEAIESGVVYFYYVESIAMSGEREDFTPIIKAKAKFFEPEDSDD